MIGTQLTPRGTRFIGYLGYATPTILLAHGTGTLPAASLWRALVGGGCSPGLQGQKARLRPPPGTPKEKGWAGTPELWGEVITKEQGGTALMPTRMKEPHAVDPRKLTSGRWQVRVTFWDPATGQRRETSQTVATEREAKIWSRNQEMQLRQDPNRKPPSEEQFGPYLARWMDEVARTQLRETPGTPIMTPLSTPSVTSARGPCAT